ncbi:hypothetical protein FRC10_005014 [Ceratobasidium sp. 414]|nr:hypothetical protein FRC10_005014 [Ceratobasidium sp. 414]
MDFLSDDEAASISRAQMSYLSPSKFDFLPRNAEHPFARAYDSSYPGAYGDDSFLSNFDHEGDSYAPNPESPVLRTASPRTFLGSPPSVPAPVLWFNRDPATPRPVQYEWATVSDSDDGSDFGNPHIGRPEILPEDSPFGAAINSYSPAAETHRATQPRALLHPTHPLANDEDVDHIFNFHSGTPTPAPRPSHRGNVAASEESPVLPAAPLCASFDSPTNAEAAVPLPNQESAVPKPVQYPRESLSGNCGIEFKSWRTGRLALIPDDLLETVQGGLQPTTLSFGGLYFPSSPVLRYPPSPVLRRTSSPVPQELEHSTSPDDRLPLGEHFDTGRVQERGSLPSSASAYSLPLIPSRLPLSTDNSNELAYSAVNTLPPLRTPSPEHQTDPEDRVLPSIQALGLPTLKEPEPMMDGPPAIRKETAAQPLSDTVALGLPTEFGEAMVYLLSMKKKRYEANNKSGDD